MTEERLFSFSYQQLLDISKRGNIPVTPGVDKGALVHEILEALEEERNEREELNNLAILMESRKFSIFRDEDLDLGQDEDLDLPLRYNETGITLLLRDPSWVFCYWDLADQKARSMAADSSFAGLFLRVVELNSREWSEAEVRDFFDIPVTFNDFRRYINLPCQDSFYCIELRAVFGEDSFLVSRSNVIENTREYPAPSEEGDGADCERIKLLSGISFEFGNSPGVSAYHEIPQRIFPISDSSDEECMYGEQ